jgi:hypothetical protein
MGSSHSGYNPGRGEPDPEARGDPRPDRGRKPGRSPLGCGSGRMARGHPVHLCSHRLIPGPRSWGILRGLRLSGHAPGHHLAGHLLVVTETFEIRRGRQTRGQHRLDDAAPVERPSKLGSVVLHPPYGVEPYTLADERRRGWLEHRAEPKHSDAGSIFPAPHSSAPPTIPCGVRSTAATPYYPHEPSRGPKGRCEGEGTCERPS